MFGLCLALAVSLAVSVRVLDEAVLTKNVQSFIDRILARGGVQGGSFTPLLEVIQPAVDELTGENIDVFEIDGKDGRVVLRGSSGPALTAAVGSFFKYHLKCDIYWELGGGYQFDAFPRKASDIPVPKSSERHVFMSQKRYYQNTCTASYTFVWRSADSMLQEVDWMAFNGINLPLAFTGQEYVWSELYRGVYGVSQKGMDQFFSGPAFLAWNRMSNLRAWGGPLPQSWIDQQFSVQKQILSRYQELGIEPVLPAFNGVVPGEMQQIFPSANITQLSTPWCDLPSEYCCPYVLSSTDPLFEQIGSTFLTLQRQLYGQVVQDVHTYNTDTFNENQPDSSDPIYLASSSAAVFSSMRKGDPQATWLMQAWLFVENRGEEDNFWTDEAIAAYLSGVPDDGMLLLDLTSDEVPMWSILAANKKKFIWCLLHNYGGARALYGNLTMLSLDPASTKRAVPQYFQGTGLTMEAIDQNPIVYEFMNEVSRYGGGAASSLSPSTANGKQDSSLQAQAQATTSSPVPSLADTHQWVADYTERRYGLAAQGVTSIQRAAAQAAWMDVLLPVVYSGYVGCYHPTCPRRSIITTRPLLNLYQETAQPATPLVAAWAQLQLVNRASVHSYTYDLVDVGRQVMSNLFWDMYQLWQAALSRGDRASFLSLWEAMKALMLDWDDLLGSHEAFLFGRWLRDARSWAQATGSEAEADLYEFNARNQVTLWGPKAVDLPHLYGYIQDYAAKNWAGLVKGYYVERWTLFSAFALKTLDSGKGPSALSVNSTLLNAYIDAEMALGVEFGRQTSSPSSSSSSSSSSSFPSQPVGDAWELSAAMQTKYGDAYLQGQSAQAYTTLVDSDLSLDLNLTLVLDGSTVPVPTWTRNEAQLKALCDATAACVAVTSQGMLKKAGGKVVASKGVTLWLKANA